MTKDIQFSMGQYLVKSKHEHICENFGYHLYEMDVASLSKSGMLHEFEVKISRSDFLCDKNKSSKTGIPKFERYGNPIGLEWYCPNYFFYVCPDGLIKESEIPVFAGLFYYYTDGTVSLIKNAKRIHKIPADKQKVLSKMMRMTVQRHYLGCTMLTYQNKLIKEKNDKWLKSQNRDTVL